MYNVNAMENVSVSITSAGSCVNKNKSNSTTFLSFLILQQILLNRAIGIWRSFSPVPRVKVSFINYLFINCLDSVESLRPELAVPVADGALQQREEPAVGVRQLALHPPRAATVRTRQHATRNRWPN